MRDFIEKIPEIRGKLESNIRKFKGTPVYVPEAKVYSMACGCIGFLADIRGLQTEDIEVYQEHFVALLSGVSEHIGLNPQIFYARTLPGTFEVVGLTARELCKRCKHELGGFEKPRPDLIILKIQKTKK
ncbi:MAG: DUF5402 family protein [Methanosarcinales archaeon]